MIEWRTTVIPFLLLISAGALLGQTPQELRDALADAPRDLPWTQSDVRAKALFNAGSEKIDPALLAVSSAVRSKGLGDLESVAKELSVQTEDEMVAVALIAEDTDDVAALRKAVTARGGKVTTTYRNHVFALMPPDEVPSLSKVNELYAATRPAMFYGEQDDLKDANAAAEGVLKIKADRLHKAGVRGQGVKVGILDFGFTRYEELKASGLVPTPVDMKTFNKSGKLDGITQHGTACTEIIHAMAPDAQIYLAVIDGRDDQLIQAAQWLKSQGVDVISYSGGSHWGPHNGGGLIDLLVSDVTKDHKTLWLNSAGNEGDSHLLVNYAGGPPGWIPIGEQNQNAIAFAPAGNHLSILINWDDWGNDPLHPSATQDIDATLFLFDPQTKEAKQVATSATEQNGRMPPIESFDGEVPPGQIFLLGLRATRVNRPVKIHVYAMSASAMRPFSAIGSIGIPATSPEAVAVGAVDVTNGQLETFSSRGPTDDNRAKPEISSYDNANSVAYGKRFQGTSAACPYAAGFAALLKSQMKSGDATALRTKLLASVAPPAANDPGFGAGITDAGAGSGEGAPSPSADHPTDARTSGIQIPEFLGGQVSGKTLEELSEKRADQPFEVKVRLGRDGNPPIYHVGDDLRLGFKTAEDSYCTLINHNAEGEYTVLPLENERLEADKKYVYPEKITVSEPTGTEQFLFICSKERVNLNRWRQAGDRVSIDVAEYEVKK